MDLELIRGIKKDLSDLLLVPNGIDYIFGVGIGIKREFRKDVIGAKPLVNIIKATYNLRIYGSQGPNQILLDKLKKFFNLLNTNLSFPFEVSDVRIEYIEAPKPRLASVSNQNNNPTHINCSQILKLNLSGFPKFQKQPIRAGVPISLGNTTGDTVGTLGFFCRKGGKDYLVSNSHVIAKNGKALAISPTNNKIYTANSAEHIATLEIPNPNVCLIEFSQGVGNPLVYPSHKMDAAIAGLRTNLIPESEVIGRTGAKHRILDSYMKTNGRTDPEKSYRVSKHGKGSCESGGWIDDVDCDFLMEQSSNTNKKALFVNQFRVIRTPQANVDNWNQNYTFGLKGDSGSLVFDNDDSDSVKKHRAIGLFFAFGSNYLKDFLRTSDRTDEPPNNCYSVVTPISVIEDELGIELIYPPTNSATSS